MRLKQLPHLKKAIFSPSYLGYTQSMVEFRNYLFLYAKNSWKLQKRFSCRNQVFAKNYITTFRGADGCDVATMLGIKFFRNPALNFPTKSSYKNFCDAF